MQRIVFQTPINLRSEDYVTFRLGNKWEQRTKAESARKLLLTDGSGNTLGVAAVVDCWVGPLMAVPAQLTEMAHDPICRTWSGLASILSMYYNSDATRINPGTVITALRLRYEGSHIEIASSLPEGPSDSIIQL